MNNSNHARLLIRVFVVGQDASSQREPREAFWNAVQRNAEQTTSRAVQLSPKEGEERILKNFGIYLKREIVSYFHESWNGLKSNNTATESKQGREANREKALAQIFFSARILEYKSLDLSLEIEGIRQLGDLLGGNLDLLLMLCSAYVPQVFTNSIGVGMMPGMFEFAITAPEDLRNSFGQTISSRESSIASWRAKLAWAITNSTLVVPVILALGVCYVAFKAMTEERTLLYKQNQDVLNQHQIFFQEYQKILAERGKLESAVMGRAASILIGPNQGDGKASDMVIYYSRRKSGDRKISRLVEDLQQRLNTYPGVSLEVDGVPGDRTSEAHRKIHGAYLQGDPRSR